MLKKEKELFIDFIGNPKNLKGVTIVFAFLLFGVLYSYNKIETRIEQKQLVDVYATNPKIENGGVGQPSYLIFKSKTHKEITFRVETKYVKSYDKSYLFSFDKKDKPYKLKVLKTELENAQNGDVIDLYSILDEKSILNKKRSYLTLEEFKNRKQAHYLEAFQASVLIASIFLTWIIVLIIKRKRIT